MRTSIPISFLTFAALCAAQAQLGSLPACAKPCASTLPANCHLDVKCICADASFILGISCCVKTACSEADQKKTLDVASQLCDTVQVTLPSAASCPAGPSSAVAAGESTAASDVSSATVKASSAVAGAEATKSSVVSDALNTASSAKSGAEATADSATGNSASTTATSSTSAEAATGAAQVLGSNMGAVGAAVAALALL